MATIKDIARITARDGTRTFEAEVKGEDEVGQLAVAINQMADRLSELYESLREQVQDFAFDDRFPVFHVSQSPSFIGVP